MLKSMCKLYHTYIHCPLSSCFNVLRLFLPELMWYVWFCLVLPSIYHFRRECLSFIFPYLKFWIFQEMLKIQFLLMGYKNANMYVAFSPISQLHVDAWRSKQKPHRHEKLLCINKEETYHPMASQAISRLSRSPGICILINSLTTLL